MKVVAGKPILAGILDPFGLGQLGVTIEPGRRYLVDQVTGRMWRPKPEHAGVPMDKLRRWEDFEMVGLTDEAAARPWSTTDLDA